MHNCILYIHTIYIYIYIYCMYMYIYIYIHYIFMYPSLIKHKWKMVIGLVDIRFTYENGDLMGGEGRTWFRPKKKSSKRTKEQVQTKNKNRNKTLQSDRPADFHPELPSKETNIYQKHPKTIIQIAFIRQKNHPNSFVMLCGDPKKTSKTPIIHHAPIQSHPHFRAFEDALDNSARSDNLAVSPRYLQSRWLIVVKCGCTLVDHG